MNKQKYSIVFYREISGREPVRIFIKKLDLPEKKEVGECLQILEGRWPLGMPLVDNLAPGLWELRIRFATRICRILFCIEGKNIILLHSFIKKTQKTPKQDIEIAQDRKKRMGSYAYA